MHGEIFLSFFALSGTVAGVYVGMEYGMGRVRGTRDWVICAVHCSNTFHAIFEPPSQFTPC